MPQCAFKNCDNNHRNSKVSEGVSFFRFPTDPFRCAEWISIVVKEREDENYRPFNNSTICSIHFDNSDIIGNQRRRLLKTAIPKFEIYTEHNIKIESAVITELTTSNLMPSTSSGTNKKRIRDQDKAILNPQVTPLTKEDTTKKCDMTRANAVCSNSPAAPLSKLRSMRDTPRKDDLKKQLIKSRKIIDSKSKKIHNLQKLNKRLKKKISSLKNIINLLQKKISMDDKNVFDDNKI